MGLAQLYHRCKRTHLGPHAGLCTVYVDREERLVKMRVLSRQGVSIEGTVKKLGVTRNTVHEHLRDPPPRRKRHAEAVWHERA